MAFGDLIQAPVTEDQSTTSLTLTYTSTATADNLLIIVMCERNVQSITTTPSGYTDLYKDDSSGNLVWHYAYKVSDGTETAATWTFPGLGDKSAHMIELEWDGSTPTVTKAEDTTNITGTVRVQGTGTTASVSGTNIVVAAVTADQGNTVNTGSWTGSAPSLTKRSGMTNAVTGGVVTGSAINRTGTATNTWDASGDTTGSAQAMHGMIAVFTSTATVVPVYMHHRRLLVG